mgnify:CR=1 FL=1
MNHGNIINVYENYKEGKSYKQNGTSKDIIYAVYEYIHGGELYDFMETEEGFSEDVARTYFNKMLDILEYMHSNGIVHRDIKPENFMLHTDVS